MSSDLCRVLLWSTLATTPLADAHAQATTAAERLASWRQHAAMAASSPFKELRWRPVGPMQSGARIEAIAVPATDRNTIYVGVGSGNLWKSTNNGTTWTPIFEHESTCSIGDVAVAPSNPDVIWVGTGETQPRHSGYSYAGTGVFRSADRGATWHNTGLHDTHHIGKVLINPRDADVVRVAAIGHFWTPNEERGVFETRDGGETWQKVLFVDANTGAVDLASHPETPDVVFAALWQHGGGEGSKPGWRGGERSGVFRTTDGGRSWARLEGGLPGGPLGRIGLAVAPSDSRVVYAFVDDQNPVDDERRQIVGGTLYRSDDAGDTWRKANEDDLHPVFGIYGWKFCDVHVSPQDPDEVFVLGNRAFHSSDGGKTFARIGEHIVRVHDTRGEIMHLDHHDVWIDPENADRILLGNDGGLFQSWDRGRTWLHHNNIPASEFYAVSVDDREPFQIFGGTQDNAALYGPSDIDITNATLDPWENVYLDKWTGGDSFDTLLDPTDARFVYYEHQHGGLRRMDLAGESVLSGGPSSHGIRPRAPKGEEPWRFGWHAPLLLSAHDADALFMGGNRLLVTRDRGESWSALSPDLSDPKGESWDAVPFGTITTIAESPRDARLLYVGTEGGSVQRTRDGGESWERIDGSLPDQWVSRVIASGHDDGVAYCALIGYRQDDFAARLFASDDFGATWRGIATGLPAESIYVVREDPSKPDVLYVGTSRGVFVTTDAGDTWHVLGSGLATTPVHDLVVHARDRKLVAGTHGRSVWVLDLP